MIAVFIKHKKVMTKATWYIVPILMLFDVIASSPEHFIEPNVKNVIDDRLCSLWLTSGHNDDACNACKYIVWLWL